MRMPNDQKIASLSHQSGLMAVAFGALGLCPIYFFGPSLFSLAWITVCCIAAIVVWWRVFKPPLDTLISEDLEWAEKKLRERREEAFK